MRLLDKLFKNKLNVNIGEKYENTLLKKYGNCKQLIHYGIKILFITDTHNCLAYTDEYIKYLMDADQKLHPIRKTRYCLTENNQYFEIDIYPEWKNQAIMEIELNDKKKKVNVPKFINIVKEVTNDDSYKNYEMAKSMPKELVKKKN